MHDTWIELAHEKNVFHYPPALYWLSAQYACKEVGITDGAIATWHVNHDFSYLCTSGSFSRAGRVILERLENDRNFLKKIVEVNKNKIPSMLKAAEKLSGDLGDVSGAELYERWSEWLKEFIGLMTYSVMGTVMEMEEPLLTNKLEKLLIDTVDKDGKSVGTYFQILTTPTERTIAVQEEIDLLKLRFKQLDSGVTDEDLSDHTKKYSWIAFGYNGPGWTVNDMRKRLQQLSSDRREVERCIREKNGVEKNLILRQNEAEHALGLGDHEAYLFEILRTLGFWKFERKLKNQQAHEMMEDFIREIAKRHDLSMSQTKMIAPYEMKEVLVSRKVNQSLLNQRIKESVVLFRGTSCEIFEGDRVTALSQAIRASLAVDPAIQELHGSTAYPGVATGAVKRIDIPEEMEKMNDGDILISASTSPHILSAMKRAGAVVTDSGGITCHAAIVAREIKIPTVIGTKIATKIFKDGDVVEVDAHKGTVRKLKV